VRVDGEGASRIIHVQAPSATIGRCDEAFANRVADALHTPVNAAAIRKVNNGPVWIVCDLDEAGIVRALSPDLPAIAAICEHVPAVGACVFGREHNSNTAMAVRAFCPADGMPEDPVTGSANAAIAAYLQETNGLAAYGQRYRASQGREVGRDGLVEVNVDIATSAITIGGACVIGVHGELRAELNRLCIHNQVKNNNGRECGRCCFYKDAALEAVFSKTGIHANALVAFHFAAIDTSVITVVRQTQAEMLVEIVAHRGTDITAVAMETLRTEVFDVGIYR
jgi:hypothetical protein